MDIQYIFKRSSCGVSESVSTDLSINNFIGAHLERHVAVHFFLATLVMRPQLSVSHSLTLVQTERQTQSPEDES